MAQRKFRVLSIDGGGVRGLIPARILEEVEKRTKKPISDLFDLLVGTSTGGIITLALASPNQTKSPKFKACDLIQLYLERSKEIFKTSLWRKLYTGGGMWAARYDRSSYDAILDEYFGDLLLSQTLLPVLVTAYCIDEGKPHFFTTTAAKQQGHDFYLKDVAGATSAAPTYFVPKKLYDQKGNLFYEADGGIYANNPSSIAILEAFKIDPGLQKTDIHLVSISTGKLKLSQSASQLTDSGIIGWVAKANLIDVMMNANSAYADSEIETLYPYSHRLEVTLPDNLGQMDNTDPTHLNALIQTAEDYILHSSGKIDDICTCLTTNNYLEKADVIREEVIF